MNRIKQLPENLVARIAAGEVVERPASVLKELIENSVDAGAQKISVEIKGAGRTLLKVSDDGSGMSKEDAHLALRRHATSKISNYEDLESLVTFGFRGEALPSIAAVSRFRLTTREKGQDSGWELILEGGKLISEKPIAREPGTTIEVRDLFFNTPARFKFMKADFTERTQCFRIIEEMIFSSLGVEFSAQVEDAKPLVFRAEGLAQRIVEAWGSKWKGKLTEVSAQEKYVAVSGLVSQQDAHAATSKNQFLFINKRPVTNRRLVRAIYEAYQGQLFVGRHPSWVLFLDVNPQAVDVNVHPSKREVKLAFESEIFGFLLNAVKKGLAQSGGATLDSDFLPTSYSGEVRRGINWNSPSIPHLASPLYDTGRNIVVAETPAWIPELAPLKNQTLRALSQLNNMFILADSPDGLSIIDQHAAAEKVLYEKLLANRKMATPEVQMLLVPFNWEVAVSLIPVVREKLPELQKFGFLIEPFGGSTFLVKGYPSVLGEKFDVLSLLDGMTDFVGESSVEHKLAALAACKGSVRAGDPLDLKSCQHLLDQLVRCEAPHTCPHGRPTLVQMSYHNLERRFRRI